MGFQRHVSALKDHPERGFAVLLQMPKRNSDDAVAQEEQTYRLICELIRELDPFSEKRKKPLSIAVLFRQNKHVLECYETMKILAPEIRVSMEGKLMLKQSMCCSVFRQILRFAAHPGDQTAPAFLGMLRTDAFPGGLAAMKQAFYPGKEGSFPQLIRAEIGRNGFAPLLDHFCRVFPNAVSMEEEYVRLLRQCLIRYDQGNERDPDELVRQLDRCQGKQRSESKSVQLMTIHQSKGLGFDVVILPDEKSVPGRQDPFVVNETYNRLYFQPAKGI